MKYLNITTGINEATHRGSNAIDLAGLNTGVDNAFAPFDAVVKKTWANGNTVWIESLNPVRFSDGSVDYAVAYFTHDNNIGDLFVGKVIRQGEVFYQEGVAGQATGNHIHFEIAKGKFTGTGWYQNSFNYWVLNNSVAPWLACYLDGTIIINGYNYPWKELITMEKVSTAVLRIGHSELEGWDSDKVHAGEYDKLFIDSWGGKTANEFIQAKWDQNAAHRAKRKLHADFYAKYSPIIADLEARPQIKEVIIEKPVDREVITYVDKIVYQDRIVEKEVVRSDDDRTIGDLFGVLLKKIFKVK